MPYISMSDLKKIDQYITKQCSKILVKDLPDDEAEQEIENYAEIYLIFRDLYKKNDVLREEGKQSMRKWRAENPEKAKTYSREYMRMYNRRKKENK